jgi:hypothetical protein
MGKRTLFPLGLLRVLSKGSSCVQRLLIFWGGFAGCVLQIVLMAKLMVGPTGFEPVTSRM